MFFGKKMTMEEKEKELALVKAERMKAEKSQRLDEALRSEKNKLKAAKANPKVKAFKAWSKKQAKAAKKRSKKRKGMKGFNKALMGEREGQNIFSVGSGSKKKERNIWTDW
jgi:hypothetical protein